jgi:hypothetical protein
LLLDRVLKWALVGTTDNTERIEEKIKSLSTGTVNAEVGFWAWDRPN